MTNPSTYRLTEEALQARIALEKATGKAASAIISEALVEKYSGTFATPIIELSLLDPTEHANLIAQISKLESLHKNNLRKWKKVLPSDKNIVQKITDQISITNKEIDHLRHLRLLISCFAKLQSSLKSDDLLTLDSIKNSHYKLTLEIKDLENEIIDHEAHNEELEKQISAIRKEFDEHKIHSESLISILRTERNNAISNSAASKAINGTATEIAKIIDALPETEMHLLRFAAEGFKRQISEAAKRNSSDAAPYEVIMKIIKPLIL
jgi:chromosome segregation ATPase